MPVSQTLRLLVTDINHHVRDLIKREMEREGHTVLCVGSGMEISRNLTDTFAPDVIVIDPEVLNTCGRRVLEEIIRQGPAIQLIFHAYDEWIGEIEIGENIHVVEKSAASIGPLKEMIRRCSQLRPAAEGEER